MPQHGNRGYSNGFGQNGGGNSNGYNGFGQNSGQNSYDGYNSGFSHNGYNNGYSNSHNSTPRSRLYEDPANVHHNNSGPNYTQNEQNIVHRIRLLESEVSKHAASITAIEQAACDRSIQVLDFALAEDPEQEMETTQSLYDAIWSQILIPMQFSKKILQIESIHRLGSPKKGKPNSKGKVYVPPVRVTFVTVQERLLVTSNLDKAKSSEPWSIVYDNPRILKGQTSRMKSLSWLLRNEKGNENLKTRIVVRGQRIKIQTKDGNDDKAKWLYLKDNEYDRLNDEYNRREASHKNRNVNNQRRR